MKRTTVFSLLMALVIALVALLIPAMPVSAASSLKLSRNVAAPGDTILVQGFGFTAGDAVVISADLRVSNHAETVQAVTLADGSGNFAANIVVPNGTNQGTYTVEARDFHGHLSTQHLYIIPLAFLQAGGRTTTVYVIPGHGFYASGAGFAGGEAVRLDVNFPQYNGNTVLVTRTVRAAANGTFGEVLLRVPRDSKGNNTTLTATGLSSKRTARVTLHVFYAPLLTLVTPTVRPGEGAVVHGTGFVPNTQVRVDLTIPRTSGGTVTLSQTATTDAAGNFTTVLGIPSDVSLGKYGVSASDTAGGVHAFSSVQVSVHPSILVSPSAVLPGQAFTVTGGNFGNGVLVTINASFALQGGGHRTVTTTTTTNGRGVYTAQLAVPGNAASGRFSVVASSSNGKIGTQIQVKPRPPLPTATPVPTATATSVPATSAPAVPTPTPTVHHHSFGFRYVSIWYHTVRAGTYNHFVVQGTLHKQQGIWVNIWFPSGKHIAIYANTDHHGHWDSGTIKVGANTNTPTNHHVLVTFRLWHGQHSRRTYSGFSLV